MPHAKFHDHKTISFVACTIYGHGGHIGHVTWAIYLKFLSLFPRRLHMKFGFDWPGGFREEDV